MKNKIFSICKALIITDFFNILYNIDISEVLENKLQMLNRNHITICWQEYKLPVGADDTSELIKLNMIKCSLGCTLF